MSETNSAPEGVKGPTRLERLDMLCERLRASQRVGLSALAGLESLRDGLAESLRDGLAESLAAGRGGALELGEALAALCADQAEWSQATFGADGAVGPLGALRHLEKEAREAQADFTDVEEYADCLLLVLDAWRRLGGSPTELVQTAQEKMRVNRARKWGKTVPGQPAEHVREAVAS
jgi:hypothetical protein